jgi:DNA-binding PucR family transcriptional regulator
MPRRRREVAVSGAVEQAARRLERGSSVLAGRALARMNERLPWYRSMPADLRAWVGHILQSAVSSFAAWYRDPVHHKAVSAEVFGAAPPELTRAISLEQVVQLTRLALESVEESLEDVVGPEAAPSVREAVLRYSREVAFAAATVYARAAEDRGAWDARLEALVVDSVLRNEADETVRSQAAALGWPSNPRLAVVVGTIPRPADPEQAVDDLRHAARAASHQALVGVLGDRLVVLLDGVDDPVEAARSIVGVFGPGPVVVGPRADDLGAATASARVALAGLRAAAGWVDAPRPVAADELLPERALAGDGHARRALVTEVFAPLAADRGVLLETMDAYVGTGGSVEGASRRLLVHPNTVRYRLRRVHDLTGWSPLHPRGAYVLRVALTLGRLADPSTSEVSSPVVGTPQESAGQLRALGTGSSGT